ncbi:MAG: MFS transporter [Clostridiales bacterium]|nr:MFS transporter [Candidatus Blautia equi]
MKQYMKNYKMLIFFTVLSLQNLAANFVHPVTPTLIQALHLPDYMFGLMFACMSGTNFLVSPFWGKLADYFDSKVLISIGCIGYGVGQFLFWQSHDPWIILFARCFSGFFVAGVGVCSLTYLVNQSTKEEKGAMLTYYATVQTVTASFGYLIGGLLGEISVGAAFGSQVVCLMLAGVGFYFLLCKDQKERSAFSGREVLKDANPFSAFLQGKKFMTISFAILFGAVLFSVLASTAYDQCFNYYVKDQFGFTSAYNGIIKAAIGFISLIANMTLCMYIIKKTDVAKSAAKILLVGTLLMIAVVSTRNLSIFVVLTVIYLAVNSISVPVLQSLVTDRAEQKTSNLVMGFYNAIKNLGGVLGALLAGFIYEIGPKLPFFFGAFCFGISFIFAAAYIKKK